jgi:hypothetical protein
MAKGSVLKQRKSGWRYWDEEPPAKAAARTYALRLWVVAQHRQLQAADLAALVDATSGSIEHLQSTPDAENAPPTPGQRDLLARLARALHVDEAWLLGDDSGCTFDHGGMGSVHRHANGVLLARAAPPPAPPPPPQPVNLAAAPDLTATGMLPSPPRRLIAGLTFKDLSPALTWLTAINHEWQSQVRALKDTRFMSRLKTWQLALSATEKRDAAVHRYCFAKPSALTLYPYPIDMLLPVDLLPDFVDQVLAANEGRPPSPSLELLAPAVQWKLTGWSLPRQSILPPPPAWHHNTAMIRSIPDPLVETIGMLAHQDVFANVLNALKQAWGKAIQRINGPELIAQRSVVDAQYRALVRVVTVTRFPNEEAIDLDQAVASYRQCLALTGWDHSEAFDQSWTLVRSDEVVPLLPRQVEDLIEEVAGRIVCAVAFESWLGDIGAKELPPITAEHLLHELQARGLIAPVHPVLKTPTTNAERKAAAALPTRPAPYLLVLDEDDWAWQLQQQKTDAKKT